MLLHLENYKTGHRLLIWYVHFAVEFLLLYYRSPLCTEECGFPTKFSIIESSFRIDKVSIVKDVDQLSKNRNIYISTVCVA